MIDWFKLFPHYSNNKMSKFDSQFILGKSIPYTEQLRRWAANKTAFLTSYSSLQKYVSWRGGLLV